MDRDEAIKLLKGGQQGIAEWNRRRKAGEGIPDLRNADLSEADLGGADLSRANLYEAKLSEAYLSGANLSGADLSEANLRGANLSGADLRGADLSEANLRGVNLGGADLSEADLSGANLRAASFTKTNLSKANLSEANLSGANLGKAILVDADLAWAILIAARLLEADLTGATCFQTVFANVTLSDVIGLDSIQHQGPSFIDVDTLLGSKGKIPEMFLRGCGVPESLIQSLPLILNSMEPIQFYSCFVSYSSKNQAFAERLHADLQAKGVRTWFDREDFKIGDKIRSGINEAIRVHDKLMLVLTEHSIASDWVEGEVEAALERERWEKRTVLFPIRLDDSVMESPVAWASHIRQTRHIGDFRGWENHGAYQSAFARLLRDLKSVESTDAGAHTPPATSP
jgi:hypothetical protein